MNVERLNGYAEKRFKGARLLRIKAEILRLAGLPNTGYFTLLHHQGPFIERSWRLKERVEHIIRFKPNHEVLERLRNIHFMTDDRKKAVEWIVHEKCPDKTACTLRDSTKTIDYTHYPNIRKVNFKAINMALYKKLKPLLPYCSWNGKDIF